MRLKDFLKDQEISAVKFAETIGVSQPAVGLWLSGKRMPEPEVLERIIEATKGQVTVQDLHDARIEHLRSEAPA